MHELLKVHGACLAALLTANMNLTLYPEVSAGASVQTPAPGVALDDLIEQFQRAGFGAQLDLARQLVSRRDPSVLVRLERGLRDDDRHARANVAFVFAALGDDRGYRALAGILDDRSDRAPGTGVPTAPWSLAKQIEADRYYAVHVLGHLDTARAADMLMPLLDDATVNYKVAWALGEVGDRRAIPRLIDALTDPDALMRTSAIKALEVLRATEALPQLRALVDDPAKPRAGDQISVGETARRAIAALQKTPR